MSNNTALSFIRKPEVLKRFGFSNSQLYTLIKQGLFPAPIKISERCSGWINSELDDHAEKLISKSRCRDNLNTANQKT